MLVLGGIYVFATTFVRIFVQQGPIVDWGPPALAVVLAVAFLLLGQDPNPESGSPTRS